MGFENEEECKEWYNEILTAIKVIPKEIIDTKVSTVSVIA